jgi:AcrR family transcriptional regulator
MINKTPPRPRKLPKQSRSQILVNAIQEACLQILHSKGAEQLSTQNIADVAGVNIASVYQYFPNKDAVLASVYDKELQYLADLTAEHFADIHAMSERTLEGTLGAIIDLEADQLVALYQLNPDFYVQYNRSYDVHSAVDEKTQSMQNPSWNDWFPDFLSIHKNRLRSDDIATLSFIARNTMRGVLQAALDEDPGLLASETFRAEILTVLLRYLVDDAHSSQ